MRRTRVLWKHDITWKPAGCCLATAATTKSARSSSMVVVDVSRCSHARYEEKRFRVSVSDSTVRPDGTVEFPCSKQLSNQCRCRSATLPLEARFCWNKYSDASDGWEPACGNEFEDRRELRCDCDAENRMCTPRRVTVLQMV